MTNLNSGITVLVTGGTGFVGIHCIVELLQKGYKVKTTIRSVSKKSKVLDLLATSGLSSRIDLTFIEADLTNDKGWDEAVKDCTYVLHVASPIFLVLPKDENEMIRPAVDGALRVLKAAKCAGVKRVVMTSNFGAIGYSHKDPKTEITENEWTDPNEKGLSSYNKSKVMAEKAAWDFINNEGGNMELSVINPVAIFGPALGPDISSGFELIKGLIDGSMKRIPNLKMNIIDVRDVADLHIRAMTHPAAKGHRFLALAGGTLSLPEIASLLKTKMPDISKKVSAKILPDWAVFLSAPFSPKAKMLASMLRTSRNTTNAKAKKILAWTPGFSNEESFIAAVESMIKFGSIK